MKLWKLPKRPFHFNDLKLKYKLVLIIVVVASVITMFTAFNFSYTIRQYNDLLYSQTANSLSFFSDELTFQLESIEAVSSYIAFDSTVQESLDDFNTTTFTTLSAQKARTDISAVLNRYYTNQMEHITVLTNSGTNLWWGKTALREPEASMNALLEACDQEQGRLVWTPSDSGSGILCARKLLKVKNLSLEPMGYLIIELDIVDVVQALSKSRYTNGQQFQIFISTIPQNGAAGSPLGGDRLIYPVGRETDSQNFQALSSVTGSYAIKKISSEASGKKAGSRMFITFSKLPMENVDWNLSLAIPYDEVFHSLKLLVPVFISSMALAILIAAALAGHIIKNISYQFHTLVGKMDRIKLEGITHPVGLTAVSTDSQDELTVLNSYFDQMVIELKKLIEESYVKQLLITEAELKALEQQVNPHFLYNTLNSINWLAKKVGAKEISTIAESLGSLLQNTLSSKQTMITLETELDIVSCYVKIQQIRFEDLVVTTDIDQSVLQTPVPKMTIQPLVENAILHSQEEPQDQYLIHISVKRAAGSSDTPSAEPGGPSHAKAAEKVIITITNNGSSIDVDILEHIKNENVKPKGNGIGLVNIDSRLRIIFGDAYHLHFDNVASPPHNRLAACMVSPAHFRPSECGETSPHFRSSECEVTPPHFRSAECAVTPPHFRSAECVAVVWFEIPFEKSEHHDTNRKEVSYV